MLPLITILQFLEIFFHFLSLFSLCCSVSSINLSSSSLILFSVISTLVSNPSSEHLFQLFFFSLISIWLFFITYISLLRFSFFSFVSPDFIIACWNIFLMVALKFLSDNSNIRYLSMLGSLGCFLLFWVVVFLVLDMMGNFRLYPVHFICYVRRSWSYLNLC